MRPYGFLAVLSFAVAATAGSILRFGLAYGLPDWVTNYTAWRHAHSHLMYFGWGTLGLMAMIWLYLPRFTQRPTPRGVHWQMGFSAGAALASFPAFLPNGYGSTAIGTLSLPLGSMVSGLNGLLWLVFALLYWQATRGLVERPLPMRMWDWAIVLLLLAWSGALGLVVLIVLDVPNVALQLIMLHMFLELIAVGWFTLGLLGVLWAHVMEQGVQPGRLPVFGLALVLAPTFFLGVAPAAVPTGVFWISAVANAMAAILLARHLVELWRFRIHLPILARFGLLFLGVQIGIAGALLWPGLWHWAASTQLRVFVLHALLLGWLSSGLLAVLPGPAREAKEQDWRAWLWMGGVGVLVSALLLLGLSGLGLPISVTWLLKLAAWSTVAVLVGGVLHAAHPSRGRLTLFQSPPATPPARFPDTPR